MQKRSPCKVNLLLNILGKRADGFHDLETIMHPVALHDDLTFSRDGTSIQLTCNIPELPADSGNLVYRAAELFRRDTKIRDGVRIHLQKNLPLAAGIGGGSANAAVTLSALNEMFGNPLADLHGLAAQLGSDVPFFLQSRPALATGRGEKVEGLRPFPALKGKWFLLIYPGFGVPTAWAYKHLEPPFGKPGRGAEMVKTLNAPELNAGSFYNTLEGPVLRKYPLLQLIQEFLKEIGAPVALMSGSGSTTFAICANESHARDLEAKAQARFGPVWTGVAPVDA